MRISIIAAIAKNGIIGKDNQIPWNIPGEQKLFKNYTEGKCVVMGRKTWESLPEGFRPLPNRMNIVISATTTDFPGAIAAASIEEALKVAEKNGQAEVVFIGGETIYTSIIDKCDKIYLSVLDKEFEGDRKFPPLPNPSSWQRVKEEKYPQKEDMDCGYHFVIMQRTQ